MAEWNNRALQLRAAGASWLEMGKTLREEFFPDETAYVVSEKVRGFIRRHEGRNGALPGNPAPVLTPSAKSATVSILDLMHSEIAMADLTRRLSASERVVQAMIDDLIDQGYCIDTHDGVYKLAKSVPYQENRYADDWTGETIIRFGVVSDTHLGSLWQQLIHLNRFYDLLQREGITTVYHPGDITEGVNMRQGHEYEVFVHGCDAQAQYVIDKYPIRTGIVTKFITGNHDHSGIKHAGHDIGPMIARSRSDMEYLGRATAKILITPKCTLQLNHPLDGSAYALSYAPQKTIDALMGGTKPNILLNGHHHKAFYLFYRNIHTLESGTFQAQTPWMSGKRMAAMMGGWIVEAHVDDDGTITRFRPEFVPIYEAIDNDH